MMAYMPRARLRQGCRRSGAPGSFADSVRCSAVKYLSVIDWLGFEPVSMEVGVTVTAFWQPPSELLNHLSTPSATLEINTGERFG
jgi:hypothetical protein